MTETASTASVLKVALGVGDPAPEFTGRTSHGEELSLTETREAAVLLFFFPYAFTPVCTAELAALRDRHDEMTAVGARVLAVSTDSQFTLRAFAEAQRLPFTLVSDFWPHGEIATSYGVFDPELGCARRGSFILDAEGTVAWTTQAEMGRPRDLEEHLAALRSLPTSSLPTSGNR